MIHQLKVTRLRASTLLRLSFVGMLLTLYPFSIVAGINAAFGADSVKLGEVPVHGWQAIIGLLLFPPIFAAVFSAFWLAATWPGLWLFSKFKSMNLSFYITDLAQDSNENL